MKATDIPLATTKLSDFFFNFFNDNNLNSEVEVVLLGSQVILYDYKFISNHFLLSSIELDIQVSFQEKLNADKEKINKILDTLIVAYGFQSPLHKNELFYIDLVSETHDEIQKQFDSWPKNWKIRSKRETIQKGNIVTHIIIPDPHDIAALKMNAHREKDLEYNKTLIQGSILQKKKLMKSIKEIPNLFNSSKYFLIKRKINYYFKLPQINIHNKKNGA